MLYQADVDPNLYATQISGNVGVPLNVAAIFDSTVAGGQDTRFCDYQDSN